jgi:hypothetical protein
MLVILHVMLSHIDLKFDTFQKRNNIPNHEHNFKLEPHTWFFNLPYTKGQTNPTL